MRTIRDKDTFIKFVRELKKIRREFETVNQRCQAELGRVGMYYLELINPPFRGELFEHSISCVHSSDYGTMLVYGMPPQAIGSGIGKYRFFGICIDIPDFYRMKSVEELKDDEKRSERKTESKEDLSEMKMPTPIKVRDSSSKIKIKTVVDYDYGYSKPIKVKKNNFF